jgi:Fe-S cluster assembly scaffold protein SufB
MLAFSTPAFALGNIRALKGTIVAVNSKTRVITVAPLHGNPVKITVARGALIVRNGKAASFAKLRVGDKTSLKYNVVNKQASAVVDDSEQYDIHGTVEAVDTTASTITIASEEGGDSVTLNVDATTVIERNGAPATLADLVVGDKVEAKYDSATMLASSIKTDVENSDFQGAISAIDLTASTVTVTPEGGGADVVLNVVASTVILRDDTVIAITDLQVGDSVEAEYDSTTLIASKIQVEDSSSTHH